MKHCLMSSYLCRFDDCFAKYAERFAGIWNFYIIVVHCKSVNTISFSLFSRISFGRYYEKEKKNGNNQHKEFNHLIVEAIQR